MSGFHADTELLSAHDGRLKVALKCLQSLIIFAPIPLSEKDQFSKSQTPKCLLICREVSSKYQLSHFVFHPHYRREGFTHSLERWNTGR